MNNERNFYNVLLPEKEADLSVNGDTICFMPDGQIKTRSKLSCKYAVYYHTIDPASPSDWIRFDSATNIDDAVREYNLLVNGKATIWGMYYPVIAEVFDNTPENLMLRPKTKKEYIAKKITLYNNFTSNFFNIENATYTEQDTWDEITKELADYLVQKAYRRILKKDCILLSAHQTTYPRYTALTRYYGKYYCVGYLTEEQGTSFRTPGYVKQAKIPKEDKTIKTIKTAFNSTSILNSSLVDMQNKIVNANIRIKELENELTNCVSRKEHQQVLDHMVRTDKERLTKDHLVNDVVSGLNRSNSELKQQLQQSLNNNRELSDMVTNLDDSYTAKRIDELEKENTRLKKLLISIGEVAISNGRAL